jgi:hypothetical protein
MAGNFFYDTLSAIYLPSGFGLKVSHLPLRLGDYANFGLKVGLNYNYIWTDNGDNSVKGSLISAKALALYQMRWDVFELDISIGGGMALLLDTTIAQYQPITIAAPMLSFETTFRWLLYDNFISLEAGLGFDAVFRKFSADIEPAQNPILLMSIPINIGLGIKF